MKPKIAALSLFLLLLVQSASALSVLGTITVQTNEEFTLIAGQRAQIPGPQADTLIEVNVETIERIDDTSANASFVVNYGGISTPLSLRTGEETVVWYSYAGGPRQELPYKLKFLEFIPDLGNETPAVKLVVTSTSNPPQPGVLPTKLVELGQAFSLVPDQTAEIPGENFKLKLLSVIAYTPQPCNSNSCPSYQVLAPQAKIIVSKESSDPNGTSTATEQIVHTGQTIDVFGYKIKASSITANPQSAEFVVTKPSQPESFTVKLREAFYLNAGQSAQVVNDDGRKIVRLSLEKIVFDQVQCIRAPCPAFKYAYINYSFTSGGNQSFRIQEGETLNLKQYWYDSEYEVALVTLSETQGYFIVQKKSTSPPKEIVVSLDNEFKFSQNETAVVRETGFKLKFNDRCGPIEKCTWSASFIVSPPTSVGLQGAEQELVSTASSAVEIYLYLGESKSVFGHKVTLNNYEFSGQLGKSVAYVTVSKETVPNEIRVKLNERFLLERNTVAVVAENNQDLVKVRLDGIKNMSCANFEDYKCDDRPIAVLWVEPLDGSNAAFLYLRKGESRVVGEFSVSASDIYGEYAVIVVKKVATGGKYIKVSLDEEFKLGISDTALVVDNGLFVRLEQVYLLKSLPPQNVAVISVWQNYKSESSTKTTYRLTSGESLDLFGAKISFLSGESASAKFVVTQKSGFGVINVNLDEPFWLSEGTAARVVQANLRIDLLDLGFYQRPCVEGETCPAQEMATISVSNFFGAQKEIAKRLSETTASQVVVSSTSVQADSATIESMIDLPPVPFQTYELFVGQEVTVNDFTIKLLSISGGKAEFLVRAKPSDFTIKFDIARGWNLFSLPGEIEAEETSCNSSEWKVFEFDKEANKFERIQKPVPGHAYWVYNPGEKCSAKASLRSPVKLSELATLLPGWNFVPVTIDMIGKKITELGDCQIRVAYAYHPNNPKGGRWQKIMGSTISREDLGKAWAVYTNNKCRFGNAVEGQPQDFNPPALPPVEEGKVWMKIYPVQCRGNPWEVWLDSNPPDARKEYDFEEDTIIDYFTYVHKIKIIDVQQFENPGQAVCMACSCPRGDAIRALVYDSDAKVLEELGFGFSDRA